jgi:hypothetical protein
MSTKIDKKRAELDNSLVHVKSTQLLQLLSDPPNPAQAFLPGPSVFMAAILREEHIYGLKILKPFPPARLGQDSGLSDITIPVSINAFKMVMFLLRLARRSAVVSK